MLSHIYRSLLFWVGVGLLFLLLGMWFGFRARSVDICWGTKNAQYCIGWGGWGEIGFCINQHTVYTGLEGSPDLGFHTYYTPVDALDEPKLLGRVIQIDQDRVGFSIANWLVVLLYTAAWLSLLYCWRRAKRVQARNHQPS